MAQAFPQLDVRRLRLPRRARSRPRAQRPQTAGLGDRVSFETAPAATHPRRDYDLVTMFDCLHDMGDPVGAARHVREPLADDGTWMIVEPFAGDSVEDNLNPVGRAYYGFSTLLCTPASLVAGGRPRARRAGRRGTHPRGRRRPAASPASAAPPRRRSTWCSKQGGERRGRAQRRRPPSPSPTRAPLREPGEPAEAEPDRRQQDVEDEVGGREDRQPQRPPPLRDRRFLPHDATPPRGAGRRAGPRDAPSPRSRAR